MHEEFVERLRCDPSEILICHSIVDGTIHKYTMNIKTNESNSVMMDLSKDQYISLACLIIDANKERAPLNLNTVDMLLAKINKVTCPFRHGQKIRDKDLVDLSNFQIEAEEWLKGYKDQIAKNVEDLLKDINNRIELRMERYRCVLLSQENNQIVRDVCAGKLEGLREAAEMVKGAKAVLSCKKCKNWIRNEIGYEYCKYGVSDINTCTTRDEIS